MCLSRLGSSEMGGLGDDALDWDPGDLVGHMGLVMNIIVTSMY